MNRYSFIAASLAILLSSQINASNKIEHTFLPSMYISKSLPNNINVVLPQSHFKTDYLVEKETFSPVLVDFTISSDYEFTYQLTLQDHEYACVDSSSTSDDSIEKIAGTEIVSVELDGVELISLSKSAKSNTGNGASHQLKISFPRIVQREIELNCAGHVNLVMEIADL